MSSGPASPSDHAQCPLYTQLQHPTSIRLLRLYKRNGAAILQAELGVFDITDGKCPPFTTVSYTWSEGQSDEHICLNGHHHRVLQSLMPLLQMLCSDDNQDVDLAVRWFWIDSICINQANLGERAAQVQLMTRIYQKAQSTLVWLAEGSPDTHQALEFLCILREKRHDLRHAVKKRIKRVPPELQDHPGWASLERLFLRPWWRRVWTLQEFIIPERLRFYCGAKSISRSHFRQGMAALDLCGPLEKYLREQVVMTAWNRRRIIEWYQHDYYRPRIPLVSLMSFCGDHSAKDAQDRVWAVHGLARQEDRDMMGPPTYQNEERILYTRLVTSFVDKHDCLDIICYAQLFANPDRANWPSWVPDWRVEVARPSVVPLMVSQSACPHLANLRPPRTQIRFPNPRRPSARDAVAFRASGSKGTMIGTPRARVRFCESRTHMTCRGIQLGVIDGLGTAQDDYEIAAVSTSPVNTTRPKEQEGTVRKEALYSVARSLVLDRGDQFLEMAAPARQFLRDLKALAAACASTTTNSDTFPTVRGNGNGHAASGQESSSDDEHRHHDEDEDEEHAIDEIKDDMNSSKPTHPPLVSAAPPWFAAWWKDNNSLSLRIKGFTLEELCQADEAGFNPAQGIRKTSKSFYARFRGTMKAAPRRLMVTEEGWVGLAPGRARKRDVICVFWGCSVPVVLRPYPDGDEEEEGGSSEAGPRAKQYEFVGECYVDGFMQGEALALGKTVQDFTMR